MKKLLIILTLGLMFGQTKLETRVYSDISISRFETFDIYNITGYNFDYFILEIINAVPAHDIELDVVLKIQHDEFPQYGEATAKYEGYNLDTFYREGTPERGIFHTNDNLELFVSSGVGSPWNITIAVTAEFPIEDTGYMEEDFDFCLHEGYNLVSYPCENDIAINDAVPSNISAYLESIVGEGIAGVNINGNWVGSLSELQAGSGYWFKSSIEACFNYECAEN